MSIDPTQRLTDVGRQLLLTFQPLVTPPGIELLPKACEDLSHDPVATLSDTCAGLLAHPPAKPGSRESPRASGHAAPPALTIQHAKAARHPRDRHGARGEEIETRERVLGPYTVEQFLPETEETPGSFPSMTSFSPERHATISQSESTGGPEDQILQSVTPQEPSGREPDSRPGIDVPSHAYEEFTLSAERASNMDVHAPVEGLSSTSESEEPLSPGKRDEMQRLVPRFRMDGGRTEPSPVVPGGSAAGDPALEGRGAEASPPSGGVRLATGASRLAAMMREGAAPAQDPSRPLPDNWTRFAGTPQEDQSSGTRPVEEPDRPLSETGVEEVMERLADELETGFLRTYGSSGGQAWR